MRCELHSRVLPCVACREEFEANVRAALVARDSLRDREERQAWDRYAIEAMRQILMMAPSVMSDAMADAPALLADKCADTADRMLEKRRARFGPVQARLPMPEPEPEPDPAPCRWRATVFWGSRGRLWDELTEVERAEVAHLYPRLSLHDKEGMRWEALRDGP